MSGRRIGLVALGFGALLATRPARAQLSPVGAAAAGAGAAAGASVGNDAVSPQQLQGSEPPDWLQPSTGSASVLAHGCGVVAELTLSVTTQLAFVNVLVFNESNEVLAFDPGATLVQLGDGPRRRVSTNVRGHLQLQPGWQQWLPLQLASKTDLEDQRSLEAELTLISPSFGHCRLKGRIERPPGPRRLETYMPYTSLELSFGGGVRFLTTGALHELGPKPGFSAAMNLDVFWTPHHGATFDIALETPGKTKALDVDPGRTFESKPYIEGSGFFLGYSYRLLLASWLEASYSPQLGVIPFQLVGDERKVQVSSAVFCPRQRVRLTAPFARLLDGNVFAALSVAHTYVPYGELGQVELRGNLLSSLLLLGISG